MVITNNNQKSIIMVQLDQHQREALLSALENAIEEREISSKCADNSFRQNDFVMEKWHNIAVFLIDAKITLIKRSLIENEIEF